MSKGHALRFASASAAPTGMQEAINRALARQGSQAATAIAEKGDVRRTKMGNVAKTVDGIRFASKKEARYYERLCLEVKAGDVLYFLMQVPIRLPGGTKYIVDFMVFMRDGRVRYIDAKGFETKEFKIKRREVHASHGGHIRIETV